ncbi:toxin secretion, membrane fusion protein [Veronia nyctiphanis]|uniref:Toxin secretion, membrane fusion protein n=1 Tax=Veronia nyctiphanis TaxID=1278244 RepID=A0A4V1LSL0_9GAMM|nr:HlyD family efflux transporter periplasmic adaptor subunit [Veronia nyctiphanis]RXJ72021.1 toxin secretion, membrane fusion protein [Veronia nyctiphanis]RXJ72068.1 toxin secretion, membrane fusion protein [Veronia nyctiphanis]
MTLFRQQAVDEQYQRLYGSVTISPPISLHILSAVILSVVSVIFIYISLADYSRKEKVRGYLLPESGVLKVYANQLGTVDQILVNEGDHVEQGQILARVTLARTTVTGSELNESLLAELEQQLLLLNTDKSRYQKLANINQQKLKLKLSGLTESLLLIKRQKDLLDKTVATREAQYRKLKVLVDNGHATETQLQDRYQALLSARRDMEANASNRVTVEIQFNDLKSELEMIPHQLGMELTENARRRSLLTQQIEETRNNHKFAVVAVESGVVTSISVKEGEFLSNNRSLMSILPSGSELIAELLIPTRSAGFIKRGSATRLRFDAFPYQRFGLMESEIFQVDKALTLSNSHNIPLSLNEPVYRVRTRLPYQAITAYNQSFPLKSGMLLEADIVIDQRSLLEWLLDPIFSLKGRIG